MRQETGVVEAFIAGTRGWLQWNASRLISRNIIYRLSCPYVARVERGITRTSTPSPAHTRTRDDAYSPPRMSDNALARALGDPFHNAGRIFREPLRVIYH